MMRTCAIVDCTKQYVAKGLCHTHYMRVRRRGNPHESDRSRKRGGKLQDFVNNKAIPYDGDECLIWPFSTIRGYGQVKIDRKHWIVSRYLCQKVYGPPPSESHQSAHSCGNGNQGCVNPKHLSWKTPKENTSDKITHGTYFLGERCSNTKLTAVEVVEIKRLLTLGLSQKKLGKQFSVSSQTISKINVGSIWAWLFQEVKQS